MIKWNIFENDKPELEIHRDTRGVIADVFFNRSIDHVAFIESTADAERGHHYHKESTQHILILDGELEYWYRGVDETEAKSVIAKFGDIITTPPFEVHHLKIGSNGNKFIVFSEGIRGGSNYESDTYRVSVFV